MSTSTRDKLEILTGLALVQPEKIPDSTKKQFRQRVVSDPSLSGTDILRVWHREFLPEQLRNASEAASHLLRLISWFTPLFTFLMGLGAAGVLFYYDGTAPINVLPVLLFFVAAPLLFLITSFILPLFQRNPDSFLIAIFSRIHQISGPDSSARRAIQLLRHSEPVRHQLKFILQKGGATYVVGALIWLLVNTATKDLAFSWSSTLETGAEPLFAITQTLSAPWSHFLPAATMDYEVVESTRYFRAEQSDLMQRSSGRWWPFIFMCMLTYGLLPRMLALLYHRWRFKKSLRVALCTSDSAHVIRNLLEESVSIDPSATEKHREALTSRPPGGISDLTGSVCILLWSMADLDEKRLLRALRKKLGEPDDKESATKNQSEKKGPSKPGTPPQPAIERQKTILCAEKIGGLNPTLVDSDILHRTALLALKHNHADVLLLVKYWESPNIRLEKKIRELLTLTGKSRVVILPVITDTLHRTESNRINWSNRVNRLNREYQTQRILLEQHNLLELASKQNLAEDERGTSKKDTGPAENKGGHS